MPGLIVLVVLAVAVLIVAAVAVARRDRATTRAERVDAEFVRPESPTPVPISRLT